MAEITRVICKRCLLAETGEADLLKSLEELKAAMPEDEKADPEEYERRNGADDA